MYFKLGFLPLHTVCDGADITVGFSTVIDDDWYWIDISLSWSVKIYATVIK